MTAYDFQKHLLVAQVALQSHLCRLYQLVGNAAQGTYHHDDGLRLRLHYLLYVKYAFCATHTGTAKFQYFHTYYMSFLFEWANLQLFTLLDKQSVIIFALCPVILVVYRFPISDLIPLCGLESAPARENGKQ